MENVSVVTGQSARRETEAWVLQDTWREYLIVPFTLGQLYQVWFHLKGLVLITHMDQNQTPSPALSSTHFPSLCSA